MTGRTRCLSGMGITRWVPRDRRPAPEPPGAVEVLNDPADPVATVLVLAAGGLGLGPQDPAGDLLARILGALRVPVARFRIVRADDPAALAAVAAVPGRPLLAFIGETTPPAGAIGLPTLAAMLADEAAKRPAWAKLKPLAGRLGP